jgi:hypothetical protein
MQDEVRSFEFVKLESAGSYHINAWVEVMSFPVRFGCLTVNE